MQLATVAFYIIELWHHRLFASLLDNGANFQGWEVLTLLVNYCFDAVCEQNTRLPVWASPRSGCVGV